MIEPTQENWQTEVLAKARANQSGRLIEQIKLHRANLLTNYTRNKNKYDHFDVFTLTNIMAQGYLDQSGRDTLNGIDPQIELQLAQIYNLTNTILTKIATKLQVPDTGKLKDLLNYL
jgi:hypothetical protein